MLNKVPKPTKKSRGLSRKGLVRKLDKLVGDIVKARDGKCIVCGTTKQLTSGHLFSRVAYSTRWNLDNCYAQCLSCNFRHESDPYPMTESVKRRQKEDALLTSLWLDNLHRKYVTPRKFKTYELQDLYDELSKLI